MVLLDLLTILEYEDDDSEYEEDIVRGVLPLGDLFILFYYLQTLFNHIVLQLVTRFLYRKKEVTQMAKSSEKGDDAERRGSNPLMTWENIPPLPSRAFFFLLELILIF